MRRGDRKKESSLAVFASRAAGPYEMWTALSLEYETIEEARLRSWVVILEKEGKEGEECGWEVSESEEGRRFRSTGRDRNHRFRGSPGSVV